MAEPIKNGAMTIQRVDILDGLQALYLTQARFSRLLIEDSYTCGYREGFADALVSVAQMIGMSAEFENIKRQLDTFEVKHLRPHSTDAG